MHRTELTIGHLARAADVNIETIRYYQQRKLLPVPRADGAFRRYPVGLVDRIRFIKRAQDLGFTLDEIASLLKLEDGANREAIRKVAGARRDEIRRKLADLRRMDKALSHLIDECAASGRAKPCPIIATLAGQPTLSA